MVSWARIMKGSSKSKGAARARAGPKQILLQGPWKEPGSGDSFPFYWARFARIKWPEGLVLLHRGLYAAFSIWFLIAMAEFRQMEAQVSTGPLDWAWRIETTFHRACTVGRVGGKDILPLSAPEISEDDEGKGVGDTHFQEDQRQDSGTLAPAESKEMHVELPIRFMTCSTSL